MYIYTILAGYPASLGRKGVRKGGEGGKEGGREGGRGQSDRQHYVIIFYHVIERRAVVFKCLTYSTFDDVTYGVILPLGWAGSIFFSSE